MSDTGSSPSPTVNQSVIAAAESQIGVPYSWGAEKPGVGFDCSALVQWAFQQAGVTVPRTSQAQYAAFQHIPADQAVPGDEVFFAGSDGTMSAPGHVGIYLGQVNGQPEMIDAPYTGTNVRTESFSESPSSGFVGFAAPKGSSTTGATLTGFTQPAIPGVSGPGGTPASAGNTGTGTSILGDLNPVTDIENWLLGGITKYLEDVIAVVLGVLLVGVGLVIAFREGGDGGSVSGPIPQ